MIRTSKNWLPTKIKPNIQNQRDLSLITNSKKLACKIFSIINRHSISDSNLAKINNHLSLLLHRRSHKLLYPSNKRTTSESQQQLKPVLKTKMFASRMLSPCLSFQKRKQYFQLRKRHQPSQFCTLKKKHLLLINLPKKIYLNRRLLIVASLIKIFSKSKISKQGPYLTMQAIKLKIACSN